MKVTLDFDTPWRVELDHEDVFINILLKEQVKEGEFEGAEGIALLPSEAKYLAVQLLHYVEQVEDSDLMDLEEHEDYN